MNFRLKDSRNGRSLHTFEASVEPTGSVLEELKTKIAIKKNAPIDVILLEPYTPYKRKKRA